MELGYRILFPAAIFGADGFLNNRIKSIDFPGTNNHDLNYNNEVYQTGSIINNKGNYMCCYY